MNPRWFCGGASQGHHLARMQPTISYNQSPHYNHQPACYSYHTMPTKHDTTTIIQPLCCNHYNMLQ